MFKGIPILYRNGIFLALLTLCCLPIIKPPLALLIGIAFALTLHSPIADTLHDQANRLLKIAVIGLGFSLNFKSILQTGSQAIWITLIGITLTMLAGIALGIYFNTHKKTSLLICAGTAICGGSAIAALAPPLHATKHQSAVALATIFILNSIALLVFPLLGQLLHLTEPQFGIWSALSIHDTASVVGATVSYGAGATEIGLTTKLVRAIWILPLTFTVSALYNGHRKISFPLFLLGFLLASAVASIYPKLHETWHIFALISKQLLTITLFLIGTSLTKELLQHVGIKPLLQGVLLWLFISILSLTAITLHWIPGI